MNQSTAQEILTDITKAELLDRLLSTETRIVYVEGTRICLCTVSRVSQEFDYTDLEEFQDALDEIERPTPLFVPEFAN